MCLMIPGKIVAMNKDIATVDYDLEKREAKIIDEKYKIGDYVLVQGGIVLEKVPKKEAEEALKNYREVVGSGGTCM